MVKQPFRMEPGKIKTHIQKLRQDLKPMTFREKVDHIWTYYKELMLAVVIVIMILIAIVMMIYNSGNKIGISGILGNSSLTLEGHDYMTDVFLEEVLGSPDRTRAQLTISTLYTDLTTESTEATYTAYMGVLAMVNAKDLDYMLLDARSYRFYVEEELYMDLRDILDQKELDRLEEEGLLRIENWADRNGENVQQIPMGIDISSLPFAKDCSESDGPLILVFIENTLRKENCRLLWEHIKAWPSQG